MSGKQAILDILLLRSTYNVTALTGKQAILICAVRNIGNESVILIVQLLNGGLRKYILIWCIEMYSRSLTHFVRRPSQLKQDRICRPLSLFELIKSWRRVIRSQICRRIWIRSCINQLYLFFFYNTFVYFSHLSKNVHEIRVREEINRGYFRIGQTGKQNCLYSVTLTPRFA